MGLMRLILAFCVVMAHCGNIMGFSLLNGGIAVELFFIISGYYMAMILNDRYSNNNGSINFFKSRFFRLYPTYLFILFLYCLFGIIYYILKSKLPQFGIFSILNVIDLKFSVLIILSNLCIIGQDIMSLFHVDPNGSVHFFYSNISGISNGFLWGGYGRVIGPAWSIGTEILFYLFAPLLIKVRSRFLILLIFLSLLVKYIFIINTISPYYIFPAQLYLFLLGILSFNLSKHLFDSYLFGTGKYILFIILIGLVFYNYFESQTYYIIFIIIFSLSVPFMFHSTKNNLFDRQIGELSYAIYLIHIFIAMIYKIILPEHHFLNETIVVFILSVGSAFFINIYIQKPFDNFRKKYTLKTATTT